MAKNDQQTPPADDQQTPPADDQQTPPMNPDRGTLVKMIRGEEYPEPRTADVHPDEVENFKAASWEIAE